MKLVIFLMLALSAMLSAANAQSMPWRYYTGADRLTDKSNYYAITSITDYDVLIVGCTTNTFWVTAKLVHWIFGLAIIVMSHGAWIRK